MAHKSEKSKVVLKLDSFILAFWIELAWVGHNRYKIEQATEYYVGIHKLLERKTYQMLIPWPSRESISICECSLCHHQSIIQLSHFPMVLFPHWCPTFLFFHFLRNYISITSYIEIKTASWSQETQGVPFFGYLYCWLPFWAPQLTSTRE